MANAFDQFDAPAQGNAFDQFDAPAAAPAEPTWTDTAIGAAKSGLSHAAGFLPVIGPAVAGVSKNIDPSLVGEAARNIPSSAVEFAKNTVQPILHPIETAENFKNLGLGVLEKTGILPGTEHEKYADAVGRFLADRYGGIENVKRTLATDPVGLAGDLSMILTGGGSAAARAPGVIGEIGTAARAAGTAIDPLRAAAAAGRGAGHVASEVLGVTTGAGGLPLRHAQQAGFEGGQAAQAFRENITGAAPLEQAVNEARAAVRHLRQERGAAYRQGMADVGADATVLDFNRIDRAVTQAQGVKTYRGRSGTAQEQNLSPRTEGIRTEMENAIEHWRSLDPAEFHTPEGIDALKQQLGNIRDATQLHTPERVAADRIYNAVRQTIVDQVPEYAHVMQGYEQASRQVREIERTLSLNPNATIDTALRKLQSTLRDNVNTSFGRRTELADFLVNAGAPHLMQRLAGQALSAWAPRGLARLSAAAATHAIPAIVMGAGAGLLPAAATAAATLPMASPRLMGEAAYGIGRARRAYQPFAPVPRISRQIGQLSGATNPFGTGSNPYQP